MKKIAHIVHNLNPGGAEKLAMEMATAFLKSHEVSIVCLDTPGLWAIRARERGIPVHALYRQPGLDLRIPHLLSEYASEKEIDIWHAHQCTPWFYASLSRFLHSKPKLLFEEHGRHHPESSKLRKRLMNRTTLVPMTHRIVAVSEDIRHRLHLHEGIPRKKIQVIPNGAAPSPSFSADQRHEFRASIGLSPEHFALGTVGRFDPIKNLPMAISGFARAFQKNPMLRLILVGDGPDRGRIQTQIHRLGLHNQVICPGYQSDPAPWTAVMDLFFLASFSEGTSMALLESMQAGIPALVTRVGGNPEIVDEHKTGWLIASGDVDGFVRAIEEAAHNPDTLQARGKAARTRFLHNFTFQDMLDRYDSIYTSMS